MSNIKPTRAQMFNGLRKRPTYEDISQEINPDKTKVIYPNRDAKFIREDPRMTQMDGVGFFESMKDQEEATIKEQRKETIIKEIAVNTSKGLAETKIKHKAKKPQTFDMTKDDDVQMEEHEEELTEAEKYKKARTQVKKDNMKDKLRKNLAKKKATEDELMEHAEQEQRDNLALPTELTGGASSSQGPLPPKQPRTPRTPKPETKSEPKSEMQSESEATPKAKK